MSKPVWKTISERIAYTLNDEDFIRLITMKTDDQEAYNDAVHATADNLISEYEIGIADFAELVRLSIAHITGKLQIYDRVEGLECAVQDYMSNNLAANVMHQIAARVGRPIKYDY